jgi:hypothetical protein
LKLLYHYGLLTRAEQPQTSSDGKKPLIYMVDRKGIAIVAQCLGVAPDEVRWEPAKNLVSSPFLDHLLATNDVRVAVTRSLRAHDWALLDWRGEHMLSSPQLKDVVAIEGPHGGADRAAVVPDAYFRIDAGIDVYNFFLELDRSTVTGQASQWERRDWARKVRAYLEYYRSGKYEKRYGTADLRIVTVTTGAKRLAHLREVTERVGGGGRFWFTTASLIAHNMLTEPIWQVASHEGLHALIPKHTGIADRGTPRTPDAQLLQGVRLKEGDAAEGVQEHILNEPLQGLS